jgi:multidrug efflux pump subunit AcrA (membrane-fusion protein)
VILEIDERDIAHVREGEEGTLTLTGLPAQPVALHVTKITPVANSADGRNFFRVEAALDGAGSQLRPGMEGVAKLDAGRRHLIWIWTHPLIDWARLMLWKWLP